MRGFDRNRYDRERRAWVVAKSRRIILITTAVTIAALLIAQIATRAIANHAHMIVHHIEGRG